MCVTQMCHSVSSTKNGSKVLSLFVSANGESLAGPVVFPDLELDPEGLVARFAIGFDFTDGFEGLLDD